MEILAKNAAFDLALDNAKRDGRDWYAVPQEPDAWRSGLWTVSDTPPSTPVYLRADPNGFLYSYGMDTAGRRR